MTPLRIALTADPEIPVPPELYGGIERVIDVLARGLVARGYDVTLFAHGESATAGRLIPWPGKVSGSLSDTLRNAAVLAREASLKRFDIVHSFSRIAYLAPILRTRTPKVMTYQRAITRRSVRLGHSLSGGTLAFTAISSWMMRDVADIGSWAMVPNGVPLDIFAPTRAVPPDAPLVFLGRLEEIKGPHLAIEIARKAGRRLVIAGNIPPEKRRWVEANVLSQVDGRQISYIGPVDDLRKNQLLGGAAAFLMPILWDEPFGIVMAEAMACGCPVLGFDRGSVSEVVEDGVTGFVRKDVNGLVEALRAIGRLDRAACRSRVERLYSPDAIVDGYLSVYQSRMSASLRR